MHETTNTESLACSTDIYVDQPAERKSAAGTGETVLKYSGLCALFEV